MVDPRSVTQRHRDVLFPWVKPYYPEPLVLERGEGCRVWDAEGREYLDLFAGILTTSLGHCHPEVNRRMAEQASRLGHTSTLYVTEPQIRVAERLVELSPGPLGRVCFTNSGTEAVEAAITAACRFTGRSEVVALRHAYSGRSLLATGLTAHASWRPLEARIPGIVHARAPYTYRSPLGPDATDEEQTEFFIQDLIEVIETTTTGRPAAFFAETVQGVGGYIVPPRGYLTRAAQVIRDYGGLYIADEVQAGFGRTGGRWFGIEHWEVEPDIMVLAKGIANGVPVGATLARSEIAEAWPGPSISTYGGNPVSMAATEATIDVMIREDVPTRAQARGDEMAAGLQALADRYAWIGDARGMGLMRALEIVTDPETRAPDPDRARAILEAARQEGLLVGLGGLKGHVVRLGPSLLVSEAEVAEGLDRLERALARVEAGR